MSSTLAGETMERQAPADSEPRLLHEFFERQVRLRPDCPAVECNGEVLTYLQLDRLADRVAAFLRARGVVTGSLVALYLEKSCPLFAAMLGVLKAGAGYVPLDPKFPIARVIDILEDADAAVVITDRKLGGELAPRTSAEVMFLDEDLDIDVRSSMPRRPAIIAPEDVCYVIYTSGSTGRPKGVVIEHRNAVNFVRSLRTYYKLTPQDRIYQGFSIAFDASVEEIWGALSIGGTLVVPSGEIARATFDAAEFITARKVTYFSTVPSFLAMITSDLPTVRFLVLGGEVCSQELVNRWATGKRRMLNTYGPTEATVVATGVDCMPGQPVTIGTALPGYETYVLNAQMQRVGPGESGELYIGGGSIARGYLNQPELTAERFVENPFALQGVAPGRLYRTRDMVRLTENGDLQFLGREDEQIKIRGFRIELSEIEAVLMEHPAIQAAAVNVVDFGSLKELAAYVVLESNVTTFDSSSVAELLRARLPEYMIPRYLDVVAELPQMTSGKVDRKLLPPPKTIFGRGEHDIVAPTDDLERAIVDIWEQVFQTSPISVDDDFFLDLRGHSLFAAQAATEMRAKLNTLHVSVPDLYDFRTARRLAQHLKEAGVGAQGDLLAPGIAAAPARPIPKARMSWFRVPCVVLQLAGLLAFYAVLVSPIVFAVVLAFLVRDGEQTKLEAFNIATTVAFLVWPSWLLLSIALKWLVIGRYRPGRYRVWGTYYFRWWLVSRFQALSWSEMFVGTPLMSLYYRAMGAKIGKHCSIDTPHCTAFDLITIGNDTSIGPETHVLGYRIEDGWLILGNVTIGAECFVGTHCSLGLNTEMKDRSRLDDMSELADHSTITAGQGMRGSPAKPAEVSLEVLQADAAPARRGRTFLFGFIHLVLIYAMGYLLILGALPGILMVGYAFFWWSPLWAVGAVFAAVPGSILWYLFLVVAVKRIAIGRILPGVYRQHSKDYLRYWFLAYLLTNTRNIVLPLYSTLFLPAFLRLLGARIGRGVEISTAMSVTPDLLELDDGSFLADACMVGGHRAYLGVIEVARNRIGKRSFVGNSALVPVGVEIGDNGLIGVMSTPPAGVERTPDGTRWLGSPGFELPNTPDDGEFSDQQTYSPSRKLVVLRALVEILRLLLPDIVVAADLAVFCFVIAYSYYLLPLWALAIVGPCTAFMLSFATVAMVAWFKNRLIGPFTPVMKPLWSGYVWINDVVNALYETAAASAMAPLLGTPFVSQCLRMMGCKIGRWVFLETTLFSEFDLVEIGDRAALNLGATVQTHLFEDRVMKSDRLKIGERCTVGNMAVVLYGTEMQRGSSLSAVSVLMKGEVLPPFSRWGGIPTRPIESSMPVERPAVTAAMPIRRPKRARRDERSQQELIQERIDQIIAASGATAARRPSESFQQEAQSSPPPDLRA
jgi:non-ribosomal peptide synthetase-like protein